MKIKKTNYDSEINLMRSGNQAIVKQQNICFQSFLNRLVDMKSEISISKSTFKKHKNCIKLNPFNGTATTLKSRGDAVRLPLGGVVLNNIISLHILLIDQPEDMKRKIINKHKKIFVAALHDFYLDSQTDYFSKDYETRSMKLDVNDLYLQMIEQFVEQSINFQFDATELKNWIVRFSTLGLTETKVNYEDDYFKTLNKRDGISGLRDFNKTFKASYGKGGKDANVNLIMLMEGSTTKNLGRLGLSAAQDKLANDNLLEAWRDLCAKQFDEFKKISRTNFKKIFINFFFFILVAALPLIVFGVSPLTCVIALLAVTKTTWDSYAYNRYVRTVLPEYESDVKCGRAEMVDLIYKKYKPVKVAVSFGEEKEIGTEKEDQTEDLIVFCYQSDFSNPEPEIRISRNRATVVNPSVTGYPMLKNQHSLARNNITQAPTPQPMGTEAIIWTALDGSRFNPPAPCFEITTQMKIPRFGYVPQNVLDSLNATSSRNKPRYTHTNMLTLFKAVPAVGAQGIVFNKDGSSKLKVLGSKGKGEIRIFGREVATGSQDQKLIAYDKKEAPKHKKRSH